MEKTLLTKAKSRKKVQYRRSQDSFGNEEMALAAAWVKDEVNITQVMFALGNKNRGANCYIFLARALKKMILKKKLLNQSK